MNSYSMSVPAHPDAVALLRALKGAPLSCLMGLALCHPTPVDRDTLNLVTDVERDTIRKAMRILVHVYHFATEIKIGKFVKWTLTEKGLQLRLPVFSALFGENTPRALPECEKIALLPSSSSSLYPLSSLDSEVKTTTTPALECEKIALLPKAFELIETYLRGCNREAAAEAIRTALLRGDSARAIESEMILWVTYGESPLGRGIRGPAVVAASKIKKGERCPEFLWRMDFDDPKLGKAWRRWETANRPWLERLDEMDETPKPEAQWQLTPALRKALEESPANEN